VIRKVLPGDSDSAMAALAVQIDQLRTEVNQLANLRDDIAAHARAIDTLTRVVRRAAENPSVTDEPDEDPPVPEWLTVQDPGLAIAWLTDLVVWVPRVWLRYPGSAMPACWRWHPAIVAELLVARHAWAEATIPGQSVLALAQWHDRWRPTATVRVTKALTGCARGAGCHVNPAGHHFQYDLACLDELAAWWASTDRGDPDAAPGLTREIGPHDRGRSPTDIAAGDPRRQDLRVRGEARR
jgi:hypothetical protein